MAGLGRKVWVNETLSAPDLQGYLQDQVVFRFANNAARLAAIPAPSEGMLSTLDDTDVIDRHDGSTWRSLQYGGQYAKGTVAGTAGGSGEAVVTHLLGVTPAQIFITAVTNAVGHLARHTVTAKSSTQFTVVQYNTTNGSVIGGNPINFDWIAWK